MIFGQQGLAMRVLEVGGQDETTFPAPEKAYLVLCLGLVTKNRKDLPQTRIGIKQMPIFCMGLQFACLGRVALGTVIGPATCRFCVLRRAIVNCCC